MDKVHYFIELSKNYIARLKANFKEGGLFVVANYLQQGAGFIFALYVAHAVAPNEYGKFGLAMLINNYFKHVSLGSNFAINKELSIDISDSRPIKYWFMSIGYFFIMNSVFVMILYKFNLFPELNEYLLLFGAYQFVFYVQQMNIGILRAFNRSKSLGLNYLGGAVVTIILALYFVVAGVPKNAFPLFIKILLVNVIQMLTSFYSISKLDVNWTSIFKVNITFEYLKYMLLQGMSIGAYVFTSDIFYSLDRLFLASFFNRDVLGYYTFASQLVLPFNTLFNAFMFLDTSTLLKGLHNSSVASLETTSKALIKKYALVIVPISLIYISFGLLVVLFFLKEYSLSFIIGIVLILRMYPQISNFTKATFLISNNGTSYLIFALIITIAVNASVNFITSELTPHFIVLLVNSLVIYWFFYGYFINRSIKSYQNKREKFV